MSLSLPPAAGLWPAAGGMKALANQEVERYTFRQPGQATSYFYGYMQLMRLRADTEKVMGAAFDKQKFHDFILSQGTLPPALCGRRCLSTSFRKQPTTRRLVAVL